MLHERGIERDVAMQLPAAAASEKRHRELLAETVLRSCALEGCGAREEHASHFKLCAACKGPVYCCREHQVADWPAHKAACKAARKRAAAEEGGAGPSGA